MLNLGADEIISKLNLAPHPEGGFYRETFRDSAGAAGRDSGACTDGRAFGTAIYYLLRGNDVSRWHRVDAAEIWHWYGGGVLELSMQENDGLVSKHLLGMDLGSGQVPQIVVPANVWQSARPLGGFVLVGCTVAPGFEFAGFEMAVDGELPPV